MSPNCVNPQAGLLGDVLFEVNRGGQNGWGIMNFVGNAQEWVTGPSGGYEARGGAYTDRLGSCKIETARSHAGDADKITGFRLVRELGEDA
jgi:formylglycine-generating enzyme required for sulfatase activity